MNTSPIFLSLVALTLLGLSAQPALAEEGTDPPTTTEPPTTQPPPTFDVRTRELRIPCLEVQGVMAHGSPIPDAKYNVVMKQRGQSSNWEITFVAEGCGGDMPPADPPPEEPAAS